MRHQRLFKTITIWCHRTQVLNKTKEMKAQQSMTTTNRFVGILIGIRADFWHGWLGW